MTSHIPEQLAVIQKRVADATVKAGRNPEDVKLLAVSKTFPIEAVKAAYGTGQRMFGENKVQELEVKVPAMDNDVEWHLIGHLQSNKAVKAVKYADYIHAVDSVKLLKRIDRLAGEAGRKPKCLLEINISEEESKFGLQKQCDIEEAVEASLECGHCTLVGLMTMAPFGAAQDELHSVFSRLRRLRDELEEKYSIALPELSMGMSSDFEIAIEEGATIVRIGTAIFGKRTYQNN